MLQRSGAGVHVHFNSRCHHIGNQWLVLDGSTNVWRWRLHLHALIDGAKNIIWAYSDVEGRLEMQGMQSPSMKYGILLEALSALPTGAAIGMYGMYDALAFCLSS